MLDSTIIYAITPFSASVKLTFSMQHLTEFKMRHKGETKKKNFLVASLSSGLNFLNAIEECIQRKGKISKQISVAHFVNNFYFLQTGSKGPLSRITNLIFAAIKAVKAATFNTYEKKQYSIMLCFVLL
jgi:hypothetical protein